MLGQIKKSLGQKSRPTGFIKKKKKPHQKAKISRADRIRNPNILDRVNGKQSVRKKMREESLERQQQRTQRRPSPTLESLQLLKKIQTGLRNCIPIQEEIGKKIKTSVMLQEVRQIRLVEE